MASKLVKELGRFKPNGPFKQGLASRLPDAYRKFYKEWKETEPAIVNQIPVEGKWIRDEVTNEVHPVQNIPMPMKYPLQYDEQIWAGEGVIQGFLKRGFRARPTPHFWVPNLHRSVVYSEILNKHIAVVGTDRLMRLILDNYGFDHYILKTPACDLKSLLPLKIKRKLLQELQKGCPAYNDHSEKQKEVLNRYNQYLSAYTPEEIDWYGYSLKEACQRIKDEMDAAAKEKIVPLKTVYRANLIEKLQAAQTEEKISEDNIGSSSWIEKINPFAKKTET